MLVHVRLTVPTDDVSGVLELFQDNPTVTNVVRVPGVSLEPQGDLVEADVAREAASTLLEQLAKLHLDQRGGIVLTRPTATPFKAADDLDEAAAGEPDDAVIWDVIKQDAEDGVRPTFNFLLLLVIAVSLASVAVITDSSILVVGAMVVGPEFATVASICTGIAFANWGLVGRGVRLLVGAFAVAILLVTLLALLGRATGEITTHLVTRPRPQTGFIWQPNIWSFVVAVLAGAAGVLTLSTDKAQAMVGVFISVTTVPAAGNLALGLAVWSPSEMGGSAQQLGINFAGMILAGTATLLLQRFTWHRIDKLTSRWFRPVGHR